MAGDGKRIVFVFLPGVPNIDKKLARYGLEVKLFSAFESFAEEYLKTTNTVKTVGICECSRCGSCLCDDACELTASPNSYVIVVSRDASDRHFFKHWAGGSASFLAMMTDVRELATFVFTIYQSIDEGLDTPSPSEILYLQAE